MLAPVHSGAKGLCFQTKHPIFHLQLLQKIKTLWKKSAFQLAENETIHPKYIRLIPDAEHRANSLELSMVGSHTSKTTMLKVGILGQSLV